MTTVVPQARAGHLTLVSEEILRELIRDRARLDWLGAFRPFRVENLYKAFAAAQTDVSVRDALDFIMGPSGK